MLLMYEIEPINLHLICDWCGEKVSIENALDCNIGGLIMTHNKEICDMFLTFKERSSQLCMCTTPI